MKILRKIRKNFDYKSYVESMHPVKYAGNGELRICCPKCDDTKYKCYVNDDKKYFHCLAGETQVLTWDGYVPISSLAGTSARVFTKDAKGYKHWVEAPFYSFGYQPLVDIVVSRNGVKKTIRATSGHRWFVSAAKGHYREVITQDLRPGHRLQTAVFNWTGQVKPSSWGIAHGFTFGDGSYDQSGARVVLWGDKDLALLPYFSHASQLATKTPAGVEGRILTNLPRFFKDKPSLEEAPSYLYGWLAGYFAADGCVDSTGHPVLASAHREHLEFVRKVCIRLGIFTYGIRHQTRLGLGKTPSNLYFLSFGRSSLTEAFFLIPLHRDRWLTNKSVKERRGWVVDSVTPTSVVAEVFCATVPETHNFVLEDNILTGNCFKCEFSSRSYDVFDFVATSEGITRGKAMLRLASEYADQTPTWAELEVIETDEDDPEAPTVLSTIPSLPSRAKPLTEPSEAPEEQKPFWDYLLGRGLTIIEVLAIKTHYITAEDAPFYDHTGKYRGNLSSRVIIPVYGPGGVLVSWLGRTIIKDKEPKYFNAPNSDISKVLWPNATPSDSRVVLVEGVLDALAIRRLGIPAYAVFGKKISLDQQLILKQWGVSSIVLFWDKRDAIKDMRRAAMSLNMHFDVTIADLRDWPSKLDAGDCLASDCEQLRVPITQSIKLDSWEFVQLELDASM